MEYAVFKAALAALFFGSAIAFAVWQLVDLRRERTRSKSLPAKDSQPRA